MTRLPPRSTLVWAALVVATGVTWTAGAGRVSTVGAALLVVLGLAKAAVIGLEFMELRTGPPLVRALFLGWAAVVTVACVALVVA